MTCAVNNLTLSAAQDEIFALLGMYCTWCTCGPCSIYMYVAVYCTVCTMYVCVLIVHTNLLYTMNRGGFCMHKLRVRQWCMHACLDNPLFQYVHM